MCIGHTLAALTITTLAAANVSSGLYQHLSPMSTEAKTSANPAFYYVNRARDNTGYDFTQPP